MSSKDAAIPRFLSLKDAAELLGGLSVSTLRLWIRNGKLRSVKVGRRRLIREADILALIQEEPAPPHSEFF
jgi:excisionase family DNA binding protein